ncbi:MAG: LysR family transcriptional regulator [Candidatus Eremiobacteraeota bacterium]|nr:LysR family transcriptional regulator [Candidatus Eremiobacteraeota bacterium]
MNIRDLQYILAIETHGSVTRAAEACEVTQPTLSAQVAKLERELGIVIFERDGRGLRVTAAGRTVLDHARRIVGAVDDLHAATQQHLDPLAGELRLGLIPTLAPYLLPSLLPALRDQLSRITISIVEEQTALLVEHVRSGNLDAAMIATDEEDDRLASLALFDEPLWVALCNDHPLAANDAIEAGQLEAATLLLLSEGHCLRDHALALCNDRALGVNVPGDFRAASLETILNLVEAGLGVTLVPELCLNGARLRGRTLAVRPLSGDGVHRGIRLIYRRSSPRAVLLSRLAHVTRNVWNGHETLPVR